jgi:hypothetical protein
VSDNRMKDRVKVLLNGTSDNQTSEHAVVAPQQPAQQPQGAHPNQALQVLTLAQRTAEEHVARAHHQADKIRTDALAAAEQIARDAQVHAHNVRREAEKILADARAAAEQIARDSHARTEEARNNADKIVADARSAAEPFMQSQLRALWVDQPQVTAELPDQPLAEAPVSGPRHGADEDAVPAQRQSSEADELEDSDEAGER